MYSNTQQSISTLVNLQYELGGYNHTTSGGMKREERTGL